MFARLELLIIDRSREWDAESPQKRSELVLWPAIGKIARSIAPSVQSWIASGVPRLAQLRVRTGDPDPPAPDGDDRPCFKRGSMSLQHLGHQGDTLQCGNIREAYQTCMLEAAEVHEFSEISVDRNQNPGFRSGSFEQCLIARIGSDLAGLEDVMPLGAQPIGEQSAGTAIDEELHGSATEMAASVSRAITACA